MLKKFLGWWFLGGVLVAFSLLSSLYLIQDSFAAAPAFASDNQTTGNHDEIEIMKDREAAMNAALQTLSTGKKSKVKKINLGESPALNSGRAEEKSGFDWGKLLFWKRGKNEHKDPAEKPALPKREKPAEKKEEVKEKKGMGLKSFFTGRGKPANWGEVQQKRKERLDQFPNLDPEQVKDSITEIKVALKRDFLSSSEHNLDDLIRRAIQVNLPAQIAHERAELSERRIVKAFRDFFSDAEISTTKKDGALQGGPYKSQSWRVSLRQPLFRGGVLWNTFQLEMANRETARRELDKTVSDLVAQASAAYFEYERAWNVLEDRKNLFEEAKKAKALSDEKTKANLISEIEKLNTDSLSSQVQYDLETAGQDLELAKLELQKVIELDISDPIKIKPIYQIDNINLTEIGLLSVELPREELQASDGKKAARLPSSLTVEGKGLDHYIDLAYAHRSDLQVEAAKLRAARLTHKISAGKLLPEADLIIEFGKLGEIFETGPNTRFLGDLGTSKPTLKSEWRIGTELSWNAVGNTFKYSFDHDQRAPTVSQFQGLQGPISDAHTASVSLLDGLGALSDLKETKIGVLEQVVELEKTERDVIREVKEAYFNYNKALIQVESSYRRIQYRERLAKLAKHRLDNNEIQISEYLQAKMDYTEERSHVHKALADFYLSKANLNRAIGVRDYLRMKSI